MENETILRVVLDDKRESEDKGSNKLHDNDNALSGASLSEKKVKEEDYKLNRFGRGINSQSRNHYREQGMIDIKGGKVISGSKQFLSNLEGKQVLKAGTTVATTGVQAFGMYSQYKSTGHQLSGSTHAAQVENRRNQVAQTAVSFGVTAIINPYLVPMVVAMKAWNLSQQLRQEVYRDRSNQILNGIKQELLIKNTVERRF